MSERSVVMAVAPIFVQDSFRTVGRRSHSAIETKMPCNLGISREHGSGWSLVFGATGHGRLVFLAQRATGNTRKAILMDSLRTHVEFSRRDRLEAYPTMFLGSFSPHEIRPFTKIWHRAV